MCVGGGGGGGTKLRDGVGEDEEQNQSSKSSICFFGLHVLLANGSWLIHNEECYIH